MTAKPIMPTDNLSTNMTAAEVVLIPAPASTRVAVTLPVARPAGPREGFGLAKCERLGSADEFERVFARRASSGDSRIVVHVAEGQLPWTRIGIRIGRKYGNAPDRNRFKRLVREAFRLQKHLLPTALDVVVTPRSNKPETSAGRKKPKNALRPRPTRMMLSDVTGSLVQLVRRAVRGLRPNSGQPITAQPAGGSP